MLAQFLHSESRRSAAPFVAVNCAAIPDNMLEALLFGYERGAFTGAVTRKVGMFERADGGTILLDEIGDVPLAIQAKILRVLQERTFERVGGTETLRVDVRILAATNADLESKVAAGTFRSDLYYRLKVVTIQIPPLRERPEDVPLLAPRFFSAFKEENERKDLVLDPEVIDVLKRARWDGNVRELRNLMESLVVLAPAGTARIRVEDLPESYRAEAAVAPRPSAPAPAPPPGTGGPARTMDEIEKEAILRALEETGGNRTRAAEILGIGLRTLQRKLKEYGQAGEESGG